MNYVNMDKNLIPKEIRTFALVTQTELLSYMNELYMTLSEDWREYYQIPSDYDINEMVYFYASASFNTDSIQDDLSIQFDNENFEAEHSRWEEDNNLLGLHTLENGLTILGCATGGDWEWPVFFFYYFNGEKIETYVPSYGNCINLDAKTAFGSEGDGKISEETLKEMYGSIKPKHKSDDNDDNDDHWYPEDFTELYLNKQGIEYDYNNFNLDINWDAIKEEILTVFK